MADLLPPPRVMVETSSRSFTDGNPSPRIRVEDRSQELRWPEQPSLASEKQLAATGALDGTWARQQEPAELQGDYVSVRIRAPSPPRASELLNELLPVHRDLESLWAEVRSLKAGVAVGALGDEAAMQQAVQRHIEAAVQMHLANLRAELWGESASQVLDKLAQFEHLMDFHKTWFSDFHAQYEGRLASLEDRQDGTRVSVLPKQGELALAPASGTDREAITRLQRTVLRLEELVGSHQVRIGQLADGLAILSTQQPSDVAPRGLLEVLPGGGSIAAVEQLLGPFTARLHDVEGNTAKLEELVCMHQGRFQELGREVATLCGQLAASEGRLAERVQMERLEGRLLDELQTQAVSTNRSLVELRSADSERKQLQLEMGKLEEQLLSKVVVAETAALEAKGRLGRVESDVSKLEELLGIHQRRFGEFSDKVSGVQGSVGLLEGRLAEKLDTMVRSNMADITEMQGLWHNVEGRLNEQLKSELAQLNEVMSIHHGRFGDVSDRLAGLQGGLGLLEAQLREKLESHRADIGRLHGSLGSLEEELAKKVSGDVARLQELLNVHHGRLGDFSTQVIGVQGGLGQLEARVAERLDGNRVDLERLQGRCGALEDRLGGQLGADVAQLHDLTSSHHGRLGELSDKVSAAQGGLSLLESQLRQRHESQQEELGRLRVLWVRTEEELAKGVRQDLARLDDLHGAHEARFGELADRITGVHGALGLAEARLVDKMQVDMTGHHSRFEAALSDQVAGLQGQLSLLEARLLERLGGRVEALEGRHAQHGEQLLALRSEVGGLGGVIADRVQADLSRFEQLCGAFQLRFGEVGDEMAALRRQFGVLEGQVVEKLQRYMSASDARITALQRRLSETFGGILEEGLIRLGQDLRSGVADEVLRALPLSGSAAVVEELFEARAAVG